MRGPGDGPTSVHVKCNREVHSKIIISEIVEKELVILTSIPTYWHFPVLYERCPTDLESKDTNAPYSICLGSIWHILQL